jgi:hypothetical protein
MFVGKLPRPARVCVCGHGRAAHTHYRPGSDCALCNCDRYRFAVLGWFTRSRAVLAHLPHPQNGANRPGK